MNRKQHTIIILILGALAAMGPFSVDMYLPGFPAIARDLKTDIAHVGLSLTSFFIGISTGQMVYGPFIDRYGRKKPLVLGLIIYIFAALCCSLSPSILWLVGTRFFLAIGGCVGMVAGRAIVRDLFPINQMAQVFSMMMMVGGIAPIIAPIIGGMVVAALGWRFVFYVLAVIASLILVAVVLFLLESKGPDVSISLHPGNVVSKYFKVFREPAFLTYALVSGAAMGGLFSYISGSPFVFMELLGFTETDYGWIFGMNAVGLVIANQANRMFLKKHGSAQVMYIASAIQCGIGVLLLTGGLMGLFPGRFMLITMIFIYLFCFGFVNPNATALALGPFTRNAGSASALIGGIQMSSGALASALVSYLHNGTVVPMVLMMACYTGVGFILLNRRMVFVQA